MTPSWTAVPDAELDADPEVTELSARNEDGRYRLLRRPHTVL
jgi:hypothetical protein